MTDQFHSYLKHHIWVQDTGSNMRVNTSQYQFVLLEDIKHLFTRVVCVSGLLVLNDLMGDPLAFHYTTS